MTYQGTMVIDLADRARLPWRLHGRVSSAVLPG
jgi:hypothetical protein